MTKSEECANRNLFSSTNVNCAQRHCVHLVCRWCYNMSLTSISSTFQLSKRPLLAVEFVAPLARIDPIYKEEEEAFKVRDKSARVRIASRCGKTWSYSILVPSLCSHHKRENTDVSMPLERSLSSSGDIGRGRICTVLKPLILRLWDFHGPRFTTIYLTIQWGWTTELLIIICTNIAT